MPITADAYLAAVRLAVSDAQAWAKASPTKLDAFMAGIERSMRNRSPGFIHDSPSMVSAWKTIGMKGRPTWPALFLLPWEAAEVAHASN